VVGAAAADAFLGDLAFFLGDLAFFGAAAALDFFGAAVVVFFVLGAVVFLTALLAFFLRAVFFTGAWKMKRRQ
jgi:hypothetical protein